MDQSVVATRVPERLLIEYDSDDSMYTNVGYRSSRRGLSSHRKRRKLGRVGKYSLRSNSGRTVVAEPWGNIVQQVDHDREERIEDESAVRIGGDTEVLTGGITVVGDTEVSTEGNSVLPEGTEAVVRGTEEQIEAYTEGVNGEGHSGTG